MSRGSRSERRRLGVFYTPPALVDLLIREVLVPSFAFHDRPPRVIDPACGDGRLLEAAGQAITTSYGVDASPYLVGAEIDADTATNTARRVGCRVLQGDARALLDTPQHQHAYDVVIGNPPYLSQLSTATARGASSTFGGGPYADVAAEFLALSVQLVRESGGRVGLVLPMSILATRDVAPIRARVERAASFDFCWWADRPVFDANVRTCVLGFVTGPESSITHTVRRFHGPDAQPVAPVDVPTRSTVESWSWLVADAVGIPQLDVQTTNGTLGEIASSTADFRDQYYGLVGAVGDDVDGPPLVTSGLIDAGVCRWGVVPTRFAKTRYEAPRVTLARLTPALQTWATARLVPKVLVASQTKVIEAVVDERGEWLPSVPVISVVPREGTNIWRIGALLTSPVASVWLAQRRMGTGLSAHAVRVTAGDLAGIPLPDDVERWSVAAEALRDGDVVACGRSMLDAYGFADRADLRAWWETRVSAPRARRR